jgi:acyl dehydratase
MSGFERPAEERYFEDYPVGTTGEYGAVPVSQEDIIEFAQKYDPQKFHLDPAAAASSSFGGLVASGWHTSAIMMRLLADNFLPKGSSLGSPGLDELRWLRPVRPGDELSIRATVTAARRSKSKPDRGVVRTLIEVFNQHHELVMSVSSVNLFFVRPA